MKTNRKTISHTQAVILFLILTVALHVLGLKINAAVRGSELISAYLDWGSKILGAILILEMLLFCCFTPLPLTRQALRCSRKDVPSLVLSAVISILIVAALIAFRLYNNAKNPAYREIPFFGLYLNVHMRWLYPLSIVFQEFFIKAFTQENIGIALRSAAPDGACSGKFALLTSLVTAMFFFVLHLQYPLYYMSGALLLCFFTGLIYEKDRNIWGGVMIHFALGFLPRCFGVLQIIEG